MSAPRIDVLTIFPELVDGFLTGGLLGAARREGRVEARVTDLRGFATDRHRKVDDAPYGGGDGMVLSCEPCVAAVESVARPGSRIVALSPRGRVLDQAGAADAYMVIAVGYPEPGCRVPVLRRKSLPEFLAEV